MDTESTTIGLIGDITSIGKQQLETEPENTPIGSIEEIYPIGKLQQQEPDPESTPVRSKEDGDHIDNQAQEKDGKSTPIDSIGNITSIGKQQLETELKSTPVGSIEEINPIGKLQQHEPDTESTPVRSKKDGDHIGNQAREKDGKSTPIGSIVEINLMGSASTEHVQHVVFPSVLPRPEWTRQPKLNLPCGDLLLSRDDYIKICIPLYHASMKGDWETANSLLHNRPELMGYSITENWETPLHVAALAKSTKLTEMFVENLVKLTAKEHLELQNKNGNTALCLAVTNGNVKIVKTMLTKNPVLLDIPGSQGMLPLYMASLYGRSEMVNYLYESSKKMCGDRWTNQNRRWVLVKCVEANLFDVALKILMDRPDLAEDDGELLRILARRTDAFRVTKPNVISRVIDQILAVIHVKDAPGEEPSDAMKLLNIVWAAIVKKPKAEIDHILRGPPDMPIRSVGRPVKKTFSSRIQFIAAEMGNTEFLVELFRLYPDLIWKVNDNNQTVFHVAVSHRYEGIYSLLHEMGSMKDMITPLKDIEGNNMLHLVGKTAMKQRIQDVSGVAQMQRELLWFKEVEAIIPPSYRERKNIAGLTPHELFTKEHKELMSSNEAWMKDTANQCLVVATLIASIGFAAAFAVPGGYDQNNGIPIFVKEIIFIIFTISDAISVVFSSASILTLLSVFTSRYAEDDFMAALPNKLMRGIATLLLSLASMLVGFSVGFFLLFKKKLIWVPILISLFTSIPVILYVRRQYEFLKDVYHSTHGYLFKPKQKLLYQNPKF